MPDVRLNDDRRRAMDRLRADLHAIFGGRLRSLVAYGPQLEPRAPAGVLNALVLVDRVGVDDLRACAGRTGDWHALRIATPLLLGGDEFQRTLDAFPLEYGDIVARHVVCAGEDPFAGLSIRRDDLRRACEVQAKSHLIHLREGYLEARARPSEVAALVRASAPSFVRLLAQVARLQADSATTDPADAAARAGVPAEVLGRTMSLAAGGKLDRGAAMTFFPDYLAAAERLWRYLDTWQP